MQVHSFYVVSDTPDQLAAFYASLLSMPPKFAQPGSWIQFAPRGAAFAVASRSEGSPGATGATVVFEVAEIDVAIAAASARGATLIQRAGIRLTRRAGQRVKARQAL